MNLPAPYEHLTPVVIDFETYFDSKAGYTLRKMSGTEYIRDPRFKAFGAGVGDLDGHVDWNRDDVLRGTVIQRDWANVALIAHNAVFDGAIALWKYGIRPALYIDTMGMAKAVLGSKVSSFSLAALAAYFGLPPKGEMKTDGLSTLTVNQEQELSSYCIHDVELCREIFFRLLPHFPTSQFFHLDWCIRAAVQPILALDNPLLLRASSDEATRRAAFFERPGFEKASFSSNPKFSALLQAAGYEVPTKESPTAKKKGETKLIPALALGDEAFLAMLHSEDEKLAELCEARVAAKSTLLETRTGKLAKIGATGAWPFHVQFSGAKQTHRYSGGDFAGGNPQNFPARKESGLVMRQSVTAPVGHKLVVGDFSAVEARVVSFLSGQKDLMALFAENGDPYLPFATELFGRPITKEDKRERTVAKSAVLGAGYGMGAERYRHYIATYGIEIPLEEAERVIHLYRDRYTSIVEYWRYMQTILSMMASGGKGAISYSPRLTYEGDEIVLPSGLRLKYPNLRQTVIDDRKQLIYTAFRDRRKDPMDVRIFGGMLLENISQALAGELCKEAIAGIEASGYPVVGQVHDEILTVCGDVEEAECVACVKAAMSTSPSFWPEIKLGCEVGSAQNWREAKQ